MEQLTIVSSAIFFTGVARIAFVVQSYMMKIATIPSMDLIGNFPVKSTYNGRISLIGGYELGG